jgi:hypothetical protein
MIRVIFGITRSKRAAFQPLDTVFVRKYYQYYGDAT